MRRYFSVVICFCATLFLPLEASSFSFTGHVIIAEVAYDNLSQPAKQKADRLASLIWNQLPLAEQMKLDKHYPTATTFAKIALLPDTWRKWHLQTIFRDFSASVPQNLLPYAYQNTQGWHYINLPYPTTSLCRTIQPNNVTWAIPILEQSMHQSHDENQQAVIMVLLEHFVGDSEQPLHAISRVNNQCQDDRGGNQFCLRMNARGRCTKNLHSLWDNAVGFIKPHQDIQRAAFRLEQRYPKTEFTSQLHNTNPLSWAKTNLGYAAFIYSLSENEKPTPAYYREGQTIAATQLALAGYRLAALLNASFVTNPPAG
jgi:hypothetical protein